MKKMLPRFFQPPKESFFLFGPRGTGKTTWLEHEFPNALVINLLEASQLKYYSAEPDRLNSTLLAYPDKKEVIIDEVQKVPALLDQVHSLIQKKSPWQFILTGSSARKLKRHGVNLLAGRALLKYLHPFMAAELKSAFKLEQALEYGLLPIVWASENPADVVAAYAGLYLKEEIQEEGIVRQVGDFARFMEVISFSHASQINTSNISKECDLSRRTVEGYLQILYDLMLAYTVPVFTKRAKRELSGHPKFYLFDAGVFRSFRPQGPLDRLEEMHGAALEGLVGQHLRSWISFQKGTYTLAYWRTRSGVEVDFVVYGPKGLWAIEVKNHPRFSHQDLKGLKEFGKDYPEATRIFLYRGNQRSHEDGVWCLPCSEFLLQLHPDTPLLSLSN